MVFFLFVSDVFAFAIGEEGSKISVSFSRSFFNYLNPGAFFRPLFRVKTGSPDLETHCET